MTDSISIKTQPKSPILKSSSDYFIRSGAQHNCIIYDKDDLLLCWGSNSFKQLEIPQSMQTQVMDMSLGAAHTCAIDSQDTIDCWGDNTFGQTDVNTLYHKNENNEKMYTAVESGSNHNCLVQDDGSFDCWGANEYSQAENLGKFTEKISSLALGLFHTCVVSMQELIQCWGGNQLGQADIFKPYLQVGLVQNLSLGNQHTCASIKSSSLDSSFVLFWIVELRCWGSDQQGQSAVPDEVKQGKAEVSAGAEHNCALGRGWRIRCWGLNFSGQARAPKALQGAVAGGAQHSCAFLRNFQFDAKVKCWGSNSNGQLDAPVLVQKLMGQS